MLAELHDTYTMPDGSEGQHIYTVGNEIKPGVAEILKAINIDRTADYAEQFERDTKYGRALHGAINLLGRGKLNESTLDPGLVRPLEGYRRWCYNTGALPYHDPDPETGLHWQETSLYSEKYGYCGTLDGVYLLEHTRELCITDWKTGSVSWLHRVKAAAYEMLFREHMGKRFGHPPIRLLALRFSVDSAEYEPIDLVHPYAETMWRSCLNVYRGMKMRW